MFLNYLVDIYFEILTLKKNKDVLFWTDDVSYEQTEDETKVPLQVIFRPELFPEFLAGKVQSILYDWFMNGYFQVKQNSS